ncbi:MAG: FAD-binding protein [Sphingorhabdus sp.]
MNGWRILSVQCGGPFLTILPDLGERCLLVFPADADGEALAGAVAAASGSAVLGRIASVKREDDALVVTRTTHGGRLAIELRLAGGLAVATANDLVDNDGEIALGSPSAVPFERIPLGDQSIALESAPIVIGGGRGLNEAGFVHLEQIARAVGGAVSASLPAVDLGLAAVSRQVGQSGKFVTPEIYVAVGISGTPQHLAGIGSATRIVAINKDADAPIFCFAEFGAVADAQILLPMLRSALESKGEIAA